MTTHTAQIGWGECEDCEKRPCIVIGTQDDEPVFVCVECYEQLWLESQSLAPECEEEV